MNWNKWIKCHFSPIELSFPSQNITWRMWFSRSSVRASSGKHLCSDSAQPLCRVEDQHNRNRYCIQNGCPLGLSWQCLDPNHIWAYPWPCKRLTNLYTPGVSVPPAPMVSECVSKFFQVRPMRSSESEYYDGSVFFRCFILEVVTSNHQFLLFWLGSCRQGMVALWVRINRQCCLSKLGVVNMDLLTPLLTPSAGIVAWLSRRRLKFEHHLVQALTTLDPSQCCVANPSRDHWTCRARFVSVTISLRTRCSS